MKGFLKKWMIEYIEIMLCVINFCCKDLFIFLVIFTLVNKEIIYKVVTNKSWFLVFYDF